MAAKDQSPRRVFGYARVSSEGQADNTSAGVQAEPRPGRRRARRGADCEVRRAGPSRWSAKRRIAERFGAERS